MRIIASVSFLAIVSALVCWFNFSLHFNGFILNDYHEYCQIARNFYEGNGYSTSVLRPIAYKFFTTLPQPEVTRVPLYPFSLSLFFHLFGPNDNAVVLFNSICYVALAILIFLIAFELSGEYIVGLLASLMTISMKSFIEYTITAEPNVFYAALIAAFFLFYLRHPEKTLIQGILLGILYLVRANSLFVFMGLLTGTVIVTDTWKKRAYGSLLLITGFISGLVPYMIRNYVVIGKPFFSLYKYSLLLFTEKFPRYTIWTQIADVNPTQYAFSHPGEMLQKSSAFFYSLVDNSLSFYHPFVLLSVALGFFLSTDDRRLRALRIIIVAGIIIQTVLVLPMGPVPYYYMFFFPLMICIAIMNARTHLGKYAWAAGFLTLAVFLYSTVPYWQSPKPANPFIQIGKEVAGVTNKEDIILTDIPWEITWYANRRTIWLPYDLETLGQISRTLKPKYVLLTGSSYATYKDNVWNHMLLDRNYAKSLGYEFNRPILFQNNIVGILYTSTR